MTVGVAVALYNGERFLTKQLDSIRLQTRTADKVILCDDGSKDNTIKLVEDYIENFNLQTSWELIINQKNLGYARNFYHSMDLCGTDIIFLSDQDDIWELDKIEKMSAIMEKNQNINLLCCKHGIIDANDNKMTSVIEKDIKSENELTSISVNDIMRAYRWPGMAMCVRGDFFKKLLPVISESTLAHDMVFALTTANTNSFFEYDYIGVHHRRHDNNVANEESRIFKLLNLERKLRDMKVYNNLLEGIIHSKLPLNEENSKIINNKFEFSVARENAIKTRSFIKIIKAYKKGSRDTFRLASLLCDIWLLCFGKYKNIKEN